MTTIITLKQTTPGVPPAPIRVSEPVSDVTIDVNNAINGKLVFVTLTDADTGKAITVKANRVSDIKEE